MEMLPKQVGFINRLIINSIYVVVLNFVIKLLVKLMQQYAKDGFFSLQIMLDYEIRKTIRILILNELRTN
jgi:hypothetical protein